MGPAYSDVKMAYDKVESWVKPQSAAFNFNFFAMRPKRVAEPKGTVLIIAPFNFPIFLLLSPLVSPPFSSASGGVSGGGGGNVVKRRQELTG